MKPIQMPSKLQELLKVQGATSDTVGMVEDYYTSIVNEVATQSSEAPQAQPTKPPSIRDIAAAARIIK